MTEGRKILLADDDEHVQRAVTRVAEKHGYDVLHVTTGGDVVKRTIETMPELIVLDVSFPDADGRDILAALKADARTAEIAVLVWSGDVRDPESDRKIALSLGAEDYVQKTDAQTLLRKIRRVLLRLDSDRKALLEAATPEDVTRR
jgi:DNA-binding response OmpR family regulator